MKLEDFNLYVRENPAVVAYFSGKDCGVCHALKPKVIELIESKFPEMKFIFIDRDEFEETSAQLSVFTIPSILVFFDGKETVRRSRHVSVEELGNEIERIYSIMF